MKFLRKICILGSTGSIGKQTLEVVDNLGNIQVVGITANTNIKLFEEQIRKYPKQWLWGHRRWKKQPYKMREA